MKNDGVKFEALGQSWTLRFGINAWCDLEDRTGLGVTELLEQFQSKPSFNLIRNCLWAGLQEASPDITLKDVGQLVDNLGIPKASALLAPALQAAFPEEKKQAAKAEGKAEGNPPQTGTGTAF